MLKANNKLIILSILRLFKVPTLVDKMISVTLTSGRSVLTSQDTMAVVNKRPWDPILPSLLHNKLVSVI